MFYISSKVLWFFATPSNFLPSLILLGLVLATSLKLRRLGMRLASVAVAALLVAGFSPLSNWLLLPLEERFPAYREEGHPIAGIIVLGGAVQPESLARGQLLVNEAGERIIALADLARRHPDARIMFSGGSGALIEEEIPEARVLARHATTLKIEPGRILLEDLSRTTAENARLTSQLADPHPGERWLLVTSAWHMPRAVGSFRQAGFTVIPYPVDYRTRGVQDGLRPFSFLSEGLRRLDLAAKEWTGLVGYRLAGLTDELFPTP